MANLTNKTSDYADFLQKSLDLTFGVSFSGSVISCDLPGAASFTNQAAGQISVDLSGLGEVKKVLELTVVSADGTTTASSSIDSSGNLTLSLDSDQGTGDTGDGIDDIVIRCVLVRNL